MSDDFLRFLQDESKPVVMRNMLALSLEVAKQKDRIAALEAQLAAAEARLAELTGGAMVQRVEQAIAAAWPGAFQSHRIKALARDLLTRAGIIGGDAP